MFDIANVTFDNVSDEEKQAYTTSFEKMGQYIGYKPRKQWVCLVGFNSYCSLRGFLAYQEGRQ